MNIIIGTPTGQRPQVLDIIRQWKDKGVNAAVITWDEGIYPVIKSQCDYIKLIPAKKTESGAIIPGTTFAIGHNTLARETFDTLKWDVYICGADDLWPGKFKKELLEAYATKYHDKLIYIHDGCTSRVSTQPIITRQWYINHNQTIFDENYGHGYVDVDLTLMAAREGSIVKCFDIMLDHRHHSQKKSQYDEIYKRGIELTNKGLAYYESKWGKYDCPSINAEVAKIPRGQL